MNEFPITKVKSWLQNTDDRSTFEKMNSANTIHPDCTDKPIRKITCAAQVGRVTVSEHTIERVRERGGLTRKSKAEIIAWVETACKRGRKVRPKSKGVEISKMLKHGHNATFIQYYDVVVVIENGICVTAIFYDSTFWKDA